MSEAVSEIDEKPPMTEDDVIAFLQNNPDFLKNHPEAVELLIPPRPRPKKGEVADFQSYMIERLRADKQEVMETTKQLVETSRANMNNQARIHEAVLRLLESRRFDEFIHAITIDLANLLDVDIAVFLVEADGENIPHISTSGIRIIPAGTVDKWMRGKNALLQDDISGIEAIYGGGATLVKSQILLRIDIAMDTPPAILAFGSRDPHMFAEGQATDQILFLARVIERCFRSWLNLWK
ncbi:MAG: DUF484 family protein [Alphaproteobacteria bacterium]|nr:DUF484 family protein [Alphaproteobacteria bacterium]